MKINPKDAEIREQAHLMDAEGAEDFFVDEYMANEYLNGRGYRVKGQFSCAFDNMCGFYRWYCDIEKI